MVPAIVDDPVHMLKLLQDIMPQFSLVSKFRNDSMWSFDVHRGTALNVLLGVKKQFFVEDKKIADQQKCLKMKNKFYCRKLRAFPRFWIAAGFSGQIFLGVNTSQMLNKASTVTGMARVGVAILVTVDAFRPSDPF